MFNNEPTTGPRAVLETSPRSLGLLCLAVLLYFVGLCHYIRLPFTNTDGVFALAAQEVVRQGLSARLTAFRLLEPNPEFSVYVIACFQKILGFSEFSSKLPSLLMGLLGLLGSFLFFRRYAPELSQTVILLLVVNPLFVVISSWARADIYFFTTNAFAFFLFWHALRVKSRVWEAAGAVMQAISMITKYHGFLFLPVIAYLYFSSPQVAEIRPLVRRFRSTMTRLLFPGMIIGGMVGGYMLVIIRRYGSLFHPDWVDFAMGLYPGKIPTYFIFYLFWFAIVMAPFLPLIAWRVGGRLRQRLGVFATALGVGIASAVVLRLALGQAEQLPPGLTDAHLPSFIRAAIPGSISWLPALGAALSVVILYEMYGWIDRGEALDRAMFMWVCLELVIYSYRGTANRYFLYWLVPISFLVGRLFSEMWQRHLFGRMLCRSVLCGLLAVTVFSLEFFGREGAAAAQIAHYVNERGLRGLRPNALLVHADYLIRPDAWGTQADYRYYIFQKPGSNEIDFEGTPVTEARVTILGQTLKTFILMRKDRKGSPGGG